MADATLHPTDAAERNGLLTEHIPAGSWRWAIFDRKTRTLYYGPKDVHIHLTVAEHAGVLRNPPDYYRPGSGHILGGYLCCSKDGFYYYDPYSGTFPGTVEGVQEAEAALAEICRRSNWPSRGYEECPDATRVRPLSGPGRD